MRHLKLEMSNHDIAVDDQQQRTRTVVATSASLTAKAAKLSAEGVAGAGAARPAAAGSRPSGASACGGSPDDAESAMRETECV